MQKPAKNVSTYTDCVETIYKLPDGRWHRHDGPSYVYKNNDGTYLEEWWHFNKRHRHGGPAIICNGHPKEYWIHGNKVTKEVEEWLSERDYVWETMTDMEKAEFKKFMHKLDQSARAIHNKTETDVDVEAIRKMLSDSEKSGVAAPFDPDALLERFQHEYQNTMSENEMSPSKAHEELDIPVKETPMVQSDQWDESVRGKKMSNNTGKVIFKYQMPILEQFTMKLPQDAEIIRVADQDGMFWLWAVVDTNAPDEIRKFHAVKCGANVPDKPLKYIGFCAIFVQQELGLYIFEDMSDED